MYEKSNPQINQKSSKSNLKQTKPQKIIKLKANANADR